MLIQRDNFISFEPGRLVTYKRWWKFNPRLDLTEAQMETLVREGIAGNLELAGEPFKRDKDDTRDQNLIRSNLYNGWLNPAAARSMRSILMNWTQAVEMHSSRKAVTEEKIFPILLTLTLPGTQFISDYDAKLCLERFLGQLNREEYARYMSEKRDIMKYAHKAERKRLLEDALACHQRALRKYLWRAEPQKSGSIHFHLVLDKWVDKDEVRNRWNAALECVAGCVTLYQNAQRYDHRITHPVRMNPDTVWGQSANDWIPGRPFVFGGYRLRIDPVVKRQKMLSIRERIGTAIQLRKVPYMIEEGEVLAPILREAVKTGKRPSESTISRAAEELQVRAFCRAVDVDFSNPPTTRIESMRDKASVASYLAKYLSKPTVETKFTKVDLEAESKKPGYQWVGDKLFDDREQEVPAEKPVIVTSGRRLHGRIWGKSQALNTVREFGFFKISSSSITSFAGFVETGTEKRKRKVVRKVENPTLFGVMEYEDRIETITETVVRTDYKRATGERTTTEAEPYYETVRAFVGDANYWQDTEPDSDRGPNVTIIKLSRKLVKDHAVQSAGARPLVAEKPSHPEKPTIIKFTQSQLLGKFAPELSRAYSAHYHDLFYTIYNSPHHVPAGDEPPAHAERAADLRLQIRPTTGTSYTVTT